MAKKVNQFDLDEIFRHLRTNIEFSQMDEAIKVINVVSTNPNEGKSTVSTNLARIFADKYSRVLLVDGDLRNPSDHKHYKVSNARGLSNLLSRYTPGTNLLSYDEIVQLEFQNNSTLYFIPTGSRVPNPTEVLSSKKFGEFINAAREIFDYIIIDCPPVNRVSDGIPISSVADGTLYVVSSKETDKRAAKAAINDLIRNGANIFGIVLTKVEELSNNKYGYGYGYGGKNNHE
ncbi:capsular exopolysaccharide family protein [Firmicutes bacterium M10-2]|nr:capsular exopolysaccharide family protein [Firmicutes bacterium M10-2]